MDESRSKMIASIREFVNWMETHPEISIPSSFTSVSISANGKEEIKKLAAAFGTFEKKYDDNFFRISKKFGEIKVEAYE